MRYIEVDYLEILKTCDEIMYLLKKANEANRSAQGLGIWDILGGGFFVSMAKRSKMGDAKYFLNEAGVKIKDLKEEIEEIDLHVDLNIDSDFIDVWIDSEFLDILAQADINRQQKKINEVIAKINALKEEIQELVEMAK